MTIRKRVLLSGLAVVAALAGLVLPAPGAAAAPTQVTQIVVWGDSMTHGWPNYLQDLVGVPVVNAGAGGETVQETKARFDAWVLANPAQVPTTGHLCWCGHPNTNRQNNDPETIVPTLREMARSIPRGLFMAIGLTNGPDEGAGTQAYRVIVEGVNVDMARVFGRWYAEVRHYLVTDGLEVAGLEPTPEDLANIAIDVPPASLRTDGPGNPAHLNETGRNVVAIRVDELVRSVGWIRPETREPTVVTVSSSANPVPTGTLVRFTATVTDPSGLGVPTGVVQFSAYDRLIGGPVPLVDGVAVSVAARAVIVGSHPIEAAYFGDVTYAPTTGLLVQVIQPAAQPTGVPSAASSSAYPFATSAVIGPG